MRLFDGCSEKDRRAALWILMVWFAVAVVFVAVVGHLSRPEDQGEWLNGILFLGALLGGLFYWGLSTWLGVSALQVDFDRTPLTDQLSAMDQGKELAQTGASKSVLSINQESANNDKTDAEDDRAG
jgi:hypothetical protein